MNKVGNLDLWIGSSSPPRHNPALLRDLRGITWIVNVAEDLDDPVFKGLQYMKVGLHDGDNNEPSRYSMIADKITELLNNGEKVYLHCHEGRSRTAAIATIIVARIDKITFREAFQKIGAYRPLCLKMNDQHWNNISKLEEPV